MDEIHERFEPLETLSEHDTDDEVPTAWRYKERNAKRSRLLHQTSQDFSQQFCEDNAVANVNVSLSQPQINAIHDRGSSRCEEDLSVHRSYSTASHTDSKGSKGAQNSIAPDNEALNGSSNETFCDQSKEIDELSLEDEGVSEVCTTLEWIRTNNDVLRLYIEHGLPDAIMDDVIKLPGIKAPCKTRRTVLRYIEMYSGVGSAIQTFSLWEGHCAFACTFDELNILPCSFYGKQKPPKVEYRY
ncbi:hypothetical protein FGB62_118g024 [Gracilaria domingensis]|nr:hypothetical protein FGB62_118g024 [Gracilaria domingensis]